MPFVTLYLPRGCDDKALENSMREITSAGGTLLENTLPRMIRVSILESNPAQVYEGGKPATELKPVVLFRVGPGRSAQAKQAFMDRTAEILANNLGCKKEHVRAYIMDIENSQHLSIGGKHKDFSKQVK